MFDPMMPDSYERYLNAGMGHRASLSTAPGMPSVAPLGERMSRLGTGQQAALGGAIGGVTGGIVGNGNTGSQIGSVAGGAGGAIGATALLAATPLAPIAPILGGALGGAGGGMLGGLFGGDPEEERKKEEERQMRQVQMDALQHNLSNFGQYLSSNNQNRYGAMRGGFG